MGKGGAGGLKVAESPNLFCQQELAASRTRGPNIFPSDDQRCRIGIFLYFTMFGDFEHLFGAEEKSNTLDFIYYRKLLTLVIGVDTRSESAK